MQPIVDITWSDRKHHNDLLDYFLIVKNKSWVDVDLLVYYYSINPGTGLCIRVGVGFSLFSMCQ